MSLPSNRRVYDDITCSPSYYELAGVADPSIAARPGPGLDCWGRIRRPLGTLGEELQRACWGDPPAPLPSQFVDRGLVTLESDPEAAAAVVSVLMPALRLAVREIVTEILREDAA